GLVDPVAGDAAGEDLRHRVAAEAVRGEPVRAVRDRDHDPAALARAPALDERGEDLDDRAERACGDVPDLDRRHAGRGVVEEAGVTDVVEVVAGAALVAVAFAEAAD